MFSSLDPELLEVAREIILRNGDINLQNKEEINPGIEDSLKFDKRKLFHKFGSKSTLYTKLHLLQKQIEKMMQLQNLFETHISFF